jgi:hypothetical protein
MNNRIMMKILINAFLYAGIYKKSRQHKILITDKPDI